ncbi:unnamed protein product [Paramecium pentaurelia]|uniref:EGF-like domain-containing protein n=1 Tax=Paramecium pentaurelia TaxID=43138 RepID=A0A8S1X755_9CILI|nr:unnamed protein product [Paramecium pentaurelia]
MNLMQLTLTIFLTLLYQLEGHQILKNFQIIRKLQDIEQCQTNQFLDNDICQGQYSQYDIDCHYSCWKCSSSSSSNCLECLSDSNRFLENSVCKCQGNYYDENNELFCQRIYKLKLGCRFPCLNCQGKQNNDCLSCQNQMILFENECKCGEHQYFNYVNFLCEDCHPTCSECNGSLNSNCLICKQDQNTILQSNICICKEGYYKSSVDNNCYECHQNCKTCSGPANNECLSCKNNKSGSSCTCQIGYYVSQLIPNSQVCFKCHPTCQSCQGSGGEFNCLTCHANATLQISSQMCLCDSGYVWNGDSCIQCDTVCECLNPNCSGCDASQTCTICQVGKTGGNCDQSCDAICKTCNISDSTLCTSCNEPMILSSGTCNCPSGQVLSGTSCVNAICAATCTSTGCIDGYYGTNCASTCDQSCRRCWGGNNTQCNLCKSNAYVGSSNICVCNFGYYMDATYNCYKCNYTCRYCSGSSTFCTDCQFMHRTLDGSNQCVCNAGYYDFGIPICQPTQSICGFFCGNCSLISGVYQCLACALSGTHRIDDLINFCPCQIGYFDNGSQICEYCRSNSSLPNCDCDSGFEEQAQECELISAAPSNVIVINYNAIIMKQYWSENCNLSNFADKISCQCLDGYYMQNSKCLPCHRKCKTCSIISTNCIECSLNYINPPLCNCVNGYQFYDNVCISCNKNCVLCSNNLCNTCISPLILDNDNICQCTNGYYFDQSSNQCNNCQIQCNQCKYQSDYCTKCNFNRILPFKCICPQGTYELSLSLPCQNCSKQCFTCQTNGSNCIICSTLRINPPICNCLDGYYEDTNLNCLKCHKKCQTCQLSAQNCVECSQNRISSECYCKDGYYENNNEVCILCHIKCKTCNGSNEYNCLTCDSTKHFIQSNSTCICIKGYYYENNQCNPCIYDVLECQTNYCGDGIKQLYEQCDDWNNINRDGCNSQCQIEESYQCTLIQNLKLSPLIYYSSCIQCTDVNCKSCKDIKICSQCKSGYFLDDNQCNPCDIHCKECSGPSKKQCTSCLFEIFSQGNCQLCEDTQGLYLEQGKCISKCGDGILRLTEQCDDGNNIDGDGCSSTCKLEQLWIYMEQLNLINL